MNITQNPMNDFSHKGAYSIDQAYSANTKQYAPVDLVCARNRGSAGSGIVYYHTVEPVVTPSGKKHFTLVFTHDNNSSQWEVGRIYRQGEHIYTEGTEGYVTGRHVHIDVAEGHVTSQYLNPHNVWCVQNQVRPDSIFYIDHTVIIKDNTDTGLRMNWKTHGGGESGGGSGPTPVPRQDKITLVFRHMDIGGEKLGDKYEVIEKKDNKLILKKINEKPKTIHFANSKGRVPVYDYKTGVRLGFILPNQYRSGLTYAVVEVGGNGDYIVNSPAYKGLVRINPNDVTTVKF